MLKRRLCRKIRCYVYVRQLLKQYLMNSLKYELITDFIIPLRIFVYSHTRICKADFI